MGKEEDSIHRLILEPRPRRRVGQWILSSGRLSPEEWKSGRRVGQWRVETSKEGIRAWVQKLFHRTFLSPEGIRAWVQKLLHSGLSPEGIRAIASWTLRTSNMMYVIVLYLLILCFELNTYVWILRVVQNKACLNFLNLELCIVAWALPRPCFSTAQFNSWGK